MITTDDPLATLERELVRAAGERPGERRAPQPRRRRRRRTALATAAVVLSLAAAITVVAALSGGGSSPSLLEQAAAALAPHDGLVHVRLSTTFSDRPLLRGDADVWIAAGIEHWRTTERNPRNGRISERTESVRTPRSLRSYSSRGDVLTTLTLCGSPRPSPGSDFDLVLSNPIDVIRARLRRGLLTAAGTTTFDGVALRRYVSRAPTSARWQFLIDPRDGRPVAMIVPSGDAGRAVTRFSVDQRLPLSTANRALLRMSPHPGARRLRGRGGPCHR